MSAVLGGTDSGEDLLEQAAAGAPGPVAALLPGYFAGMAVEDLAGHDPARLREVVEQHLDLALSRRPDETVVRVRPGEPAVLDVVTDDMPFLVDSLTAEVVRRGAAVQLLVHPQLPVQRDDDGRLLEVGIGETESWIHLELEGHPELAGLEDDARRVLAAVRLAHDDEAAMRRELLAAAERLGSRGESADDTESADLLRWLAEGSFTLLGQLALRADPGGALEPVEGSARGLLLDEAALPTELHDDPFRDDGSLRDEVLGPQRARLSVSKAGTRSPVHRPAYLDVVGVELPASDGAPGVVLRSVGLFAPSAYAEAARRTPVVRRKVTDALALSGFWPNSHDGRDLLAILERFPRDELFQTGVEDLTRIATSVLRLRERRQLRLFLRRDEGQRAVSALVYLPRDRYTTDVRLAIEGELRRTFRASSVDFTVHVTESVLARVHFVVRVKAPAVLPEVDAAQLEARLAGAARSWADDLIDAGRGCADPAAAEALLREHGDAFPEAYKEDFPASRALADLQRVAGLSPDAPLSTSTYDGDGAPGALRLKVYRNAPLSLSDVLPVLQSLGVDVVDERPYELDWDGRSRWVYDLGLRYRAGSVVPAGRADPLLEEALAAAWSGRVEVDGLNALVTRARMPWRSVLVLRAYATYLRQTSTTYSLQYVLDVLVAHAAVAALLVELFEALLAPSGDGSGADELDERIVAALEDVESLDADRILRALLHLVRATQRTNYWQDREHVSLKLAPRQVPHLPQPRPEHEIWVYSPRFEGVHLRYGAVARGGLRWSDRREDFRTEVFGLVKAQTVKNAVIVPTGAKGGFIGKQLPDPAVDRAAWLAEGLECYRGFIRGLLDVTDNLVGGEVVPPPDVRRRDGDDTYLVVAADKGTATFSDTANAIAAEYGFWLGDAFASGGSAGYDHKAMGITARGAWESVRRHFRELDVDVDREQVTAVGIGDMSGDVFGNGMLLSEHLRLVAAFDHRHVFLDPDPDPAVSFAERRRLFALPRSSWADYDPALLSPGGGVHPRTAKSVPITHEVRARLQLADDVEALTPQELVRAVLTAPVDLLWNGGIGTYVKASTETHAQVSDKANDGVRVDGDQLRARVVGEGGNLGLTQLGRVEYALSGGRLNTDAIDNSAGVDTSDHEVNFKIALQQAGVDVAERDVLLADLTEDVARRVLHDSSGQNLTLGVARVQSPAMRQVHARFLTALESRGVLDRGLDALPSDAVLEQRGATGAGLVSPELSLLLGYAKIVLRAELLESALPEDAWSTGALRGYFPEQLAVRVGGLDGHPLRRQIICTTVVNDVVERGGMTFVFRAGEETGATPVEVVRAYTVAREVFDVAGLWTAAEDLPPQAQMHVLLMTRRLLDRTVRWLLQARRSTLDVLAEIARFGPPVAALVPRVPGLLAGAEAERLRRRTDRLVAAGLPDDLALRTASLLNAFSLLDVVAVADATERTPEEVAQAYFTLSARLDVDPLLTAISTLDRTDRWQALARASLRYDLYAALAGLTADVLRGSAPGAAPQEAIETWEAAHVEGLSRARTTLAEVLAVERPDLATMSVALRTVRTLLPT